MTAEARPLQLTLTLVQSSSQFAPLKPGEHASQFAPAKPRAHWVQLAPAKPVAQTSHLSPPQPRLQVQRQPMIAVVTDWPLTPQLTVTF